MYHHEQMGITYFYLRIAMDYTLSEFVSSSVETNKYISQTEKKPKVNGANPILQWIFYIQCHATSVSL